MSPVMKTQPASPRPPQPPREAQTFATDVKFVKGVGERKAADLGETFLAEIRGGTS